MLSYVVPLTIVTAFWLAWDYRQPQPLLLPGSQTLAPVTLEDQRTIEWVARLRAPHTGTRVKPKTGYLARRKTDNSYQARHYTRDR
jgi:hypothetical protein